MSILDRIPIWLHGPIAIFVLILSVSVIVIFLQQLSKPMRPTKADSRFILTVLILIFVMLSAVYMRIRLCNDPDTFNQICSCSQVSCNGYWEPLFGDYHIESRCEDGAYTVIIVRHGKVSAVYKQLSEEKANYIIRHHGTDH